jgi:hypothetical protein
LPREVLILPFPTAREAVPSVRRIRSGLLCSSTKSLREHGYFDAYLQKLPKEHHGRILSLTAAAWIEPELAFHHYEACDALRLSAEEQELIGMQVAQHLQRGFLKVVLRLVIESGVTPWSVLERYQKLWERYFDGSAIAVYKLGPKEARAEVVGFPLARIGYIQVGVGGIMRGVTELVAKRVYVQRVAALCSSSTLGYRLSWV